MSVHLAIPTRGLFLAVILLFGGAGAVAASTLLPRASITVHPKTEEKKLTKDILLTKDISAPDYVRFTLPAKIVEEELSVTKTFENSGGTAVDDYAKGTITFTNNLNEEQRLLPKTHMRHLDSGVQFLTDTAVVIPPNSTLEVSVTAKEKGASGDVPAGKFVIDKFSKALQEAVYANSTQAFSGGQSTNTEITQDAIAAAQTAVIDQAKQDALAKLTAKAGGASIRPDLVNIEVVSQHVSASPGSRALRYSASASVHARGFVVDTHNLISLMTLALRASVTNDEEFVSYNPDSFSIAIAQTNWTKGQARISASLTGTYAKKIGPGELTNNNLSGLSHQEVTERFMASANIGSVDVSFRPFWVQSVPSRTDQIDITISDSP